MKVKIGTRGSALAMAQAGIVKTALEKAHAGLACELVVVKTTGDDFSAGHEASTEAAPSGSTGLAVKGLFVKELEEALLDGRIDLAVHSVKDMESDLPEGLALAAVVKREDPRDALVSRQGQGLRGLSAGARVGASSLRRQAQLLRLRRDLELVPIRGNVETRLKKLDSGECDAIVLAACGLARLGLSGRITEYLPLDQVLPAPGQGALGIEIRADRREIQEMIRAVDDERSRQAVEAERAFLKALGGSCRVPVGALGVVQEETLRLAGAVLSPDGLKSVHKELSGPRKEPQRLGTELASHLRAGGADRLLYGTWDKAVRRTWWPLGTSYRARG